jgi:restriction system protein
MKLGEVTFWGIHGGRTGDADSLFLKKNCVAIGWAKMGDLSDLASDREAFKERMANAFPEKKPGAIPVNAGQLFRFVHEMNLGDMVVYPSKHDRQVHIGRVDGSYRYDPSTEPSYPNRRAVKWLQAVPRTKFSQGALHEIGSAMGLFLVKNYTDEFRAVLEGREAAVTPLAPGLFSSADIEGRLGIPGGENV